MTTRTQPAGPGRPPGTTNKREAYHAHTDDERDAATRRLRIAQDRYLRTRAEFERADQERHAAVAAAYAVGINDPEIGRVLVDDRGHVMQRGHVSRMRKRVEARERAT